ncbi:MAG: MBL fold metallo-hydrolase, partial [Pirellulales bacterium]|nr:MBL fold metallo-hydrolase [Pirellulales bacterium]
MLTIPLQSGSNGNCVYVEAGNEETGTVRLLFDAGISGVQAKQRLARFGRRIEDVDAVIISHDHSDHTSTMGVFHRKFGLPIWITRHTFKAAGRRRPLGKIEKVNHFRAGETLRFTAGGCDVHVETVPTPHDGVDGVGFVVQHQGSRLGILTDLGHRFDALDEIISSLDAVLLESNYDPEMLDYGPYPEFLKARIRGSGGH